jgi:hypothetical protein
MMWPFLQHYPTGGPNPAVRIFYLLLASLSFFLVNLRVDFSIATFHDLLAEFDGVKNASLLTVVVFKLKRLLMVVDVLVPICCIWMLYPRVKTRFYSSLLAMSAFGFIQCFIVVLALVSAMSKMDGLVSGF